MRRTLRVKLLAICATCVCIALHVWRCGCCGPCGSSSPTRHNLAVAAVPPDVIISAFTSETVAGGGFRLPGFMVWGGSALRDEDSGLYHLFCSRWEDRLGHNAWVTSSEVVHAVSHSPHGPWHLRDVALPRRGRHYWDGMATHNPTVHYDELRRQYVLFYIGTTFSFDLPRGGPLTNRSLYELAWNAKRIGVATSPSLYGPWRRLSAPILEPRPGHWDGGITSNPAAAILPNGSTLLFYKSIAIGYPGRNILKPKPVFHIGAAIAERSVLGPYRRLTEGPSLVVNGTALAAEDPYVWFSAGRLHLIFKTMQPVRLRNPQRSLVVPAGWLAYTYTAPGCMTRSDCFATWSPPQLAFNRTISVLDDDSAFGGDDSSPALPRTSWWRPWLPATAGVPEGAVHGIPAVTNERRRSRDQARSRRSVGSDSAVPVAHSPLNAFTVDRLERPQLLFNAGDGMPTHCFAAMMLNGSSANLALRLRRRTSAARRRARGRRGRASREAGL